MRQRRLHSRQLEVQHLVGHVARHGDVEGEVAAHVVDAVEVERVWRAVAVVDLDLRELSQTDRLHVAETWTDERTAGQTEKQLQGEPSISAGVKTSRRSENITKTTRPPVKGACLKDIFRYRKLKQMDTNSNNK